MKKIVIFSGTSEGRALSEWLGDNKIEHTVCVATEYGEMVMREDEFAHIRTGRMDEDEMKSFVEGQAFDIVIDATHPYADIVTKNIQRACAETGTGYYRMTRSSEKTLMVSKMHYCEDIESCAKAVADTKGNILLTTGSKELHEFTKYDDVKERLYVRVLPGRESIELCERCGIVGKHIIAMQGPFTKEMNEAIMRQFDIRVLVTKESGRAGGYTEKIAAADSLNLDCYIIGRPDENLGLTYEDIKKLLVKECSLRENDCKMSISLIGCGMGYEDGLTVEGSRALLESDIVFGASRLLKRFAGNKEAYPYYLAEDILKVLSGKNTGSLKVAVLFSGDTGFYSGAVSAKAEFDKAILDGIISAQLMIYPGVSSISYLSAKTGEAYGDAAVVSVHGKGNSSEWMAMLIDKVTANHKTFIIVSGVRDLHDIAAAIDKDYPDECEIIVGYQLGAPNEMVRKLKTKQCEMISEEGLYCLLIVNNNYQNRTVCCGIADDCFLRAKVPMTKEEIRVISISKMHLREDSLVYDVGSGTGSVAIEIAKLSPSIKVCAIEKKSEAVSLIRQNMDKFKVRNISLTEGNAPEAFDNLPAPTHAFIGGSGGNMQEILDELHKKNPFVRVVANAVTVETIDELIKIKDRGDIENYSLVTITAARTKEVGSYNMMQSENPVWICSFDMK